MSITTEIGIIDAMERDARTILARCSRYKTILSTSRDDKEIRKRIWDEKLPSLDEGCMYLMATLPSKARSTYLGGYEL